MFFSFYSHRLFFVFTAVLFCLVFIGYFLRSFFAFLWLFSFLSFSFLSGVLSSSLFFSSFVFVFAFCLRLLPFIHFFRLTGYNRIYGSVTVRLQLGSSYRRLREINQQSGVGAWLYNDNRVHKP